MGRARNFYRLMILIRIKISANFNRAMIAKVAGLLAKEANRGFMFCFDIPAHERMRYVE
jgi:hypothetical protein